MQSEVEHVDEREKADDLEANKSSLRAPNASDESVSQATKAESTEHTLSGLKLAAVVTALMLTILCVALDNTSW